MLFINYILLICYLNDISIDPVITTSLISSYILTGVSAFLVNDYYDKEVDQKAGKLNLTDAISPYLVGCAILISFALSFLLINRISHNASLLLLVQFAALFAYSHPIIRLKTKPILGIITDSAYAYLIPVLLLFVVFDIKVSDPKSFAFLLFNFCLGIRDILLHQKNDQSNDIKSGINSFAIRYKARVQAVIIIFEFIASYSLCLFLIINFWNSENQNYVLGIVTAYLLTPLLPFFKIQKLIEINYLLRFYVVVSSFIIFFWLFDEKKYYFIILLIHPYIISIIQFFRPFILQLLIQIKHITSLIVNYLLYFLFKLVGRDLKKKPLYTRYDKKSSN
jgi:hypothetical protein